MKDYLDNKIQLRIINLSDKKDFELFPLFFLAPIFLCFSIFFDSCGLFCISIGIIILLIINRANSINKLLSIFILVFISYLVYLRVISFDFLPQAYDLLEIDTSLLFWIKQGHVHTIRLAIVYPSYLLHEFFDIELNYAFSYYCAIVFATMFSFLSEIKKIYINNSKTICSDIILMMFVLFLSTIMNGRICFAFLGFAILISEMTTMYLEKNPPKWFSRYIKIGIGIILSTVSSGTMVVCIAFTILMFCTRIIKHKRIERGAIRLVVICAILSPILIKGLQYVETMVNKNITFFGGGFNGIINMLNHGIGGIFGTSSTLLVIGLLFSGIFILVLNIYVIIYVYKKHQKIFPLFFGANLAFYGSFVGLSTGTLILVPGIVCILIGINLIIKRV